MSYYLPGILMLITLVIYSAHGQGLKDNTNDAAALADQFFRQQDGDLNYAELYENFLQSLSDPQDLNKVTADDLRKLHLLTENQITSLLDHREKTGNILSIYELQGLKYFDANLIRILNGLFKIGDSGNWGWKGIMNRVIHEKNNFFLYRTETTLERQTGYRENNLYFTPYRGSPLRVISRYRAAHSGDFNIGFLSERDAGEKFRWDPAGKSFGPDFLSGYVQLKDKGKIRNLIAGDFLAGFGQGLILSSGFSTGKGSETVTGLRKANQGFTPYTSSAESGFFRGVAMSWLPLQKFTINAFVSSFLRDGNISINQDSIEFVGSLYSTGYHRTSAELHRRKSWREQNAGAIFQYSRKNLEFGIINSFQNFSVPVMPGNTIYNQFNFRGKTNYNSGFYINQNIRNFSCFSEYARSGTNASAWLTGCLAALTPGFDIAFLLRKYSTGFHAFYSGALAEHTQPENEQGIYVGWKYKPDKKNVFTGYVDYFEFPWLGFRSYQPSSGNDMLLRYSRQLSKKNIIWVQFRREEKIKNVPRFSGNYYLTEPVIRQSWIINFDYRLSDVFSGRSRIQLNSFDRSGQLNNGYLLQQDIYFQFKRWKASMRYALFDATAFDVRIYAYERDVWLSYSFPAYYGKGLRAYAVLQYHVNTRMDIWFRWAVTAYADRTQIGYGLEAIEGNKRNDIKFQLRYRL